MLKLLQVRVLDPRSFGHVDLFGYLVISFPVFLHSLSFPTVSPPARSQSVTALLEPHARPAVYGLLVNARLQCTAAPQPNDLHLDAHTALGRRRWLLLL